jgi:flagellar M-ring protein FliF
VSYQRALQGELARSITSLENVKQARVHLVLPESTLFKRDRQHATAAVTVTMKPGHSLDRPQIDGVQRLVAASVAGLDPSRVVITDQRGVTLSASDPADSSMGSVGTRLDMQRQVEAHISQKIAKLLDSAVGHGQAIVSVTAAISFDAIKTTTQDVVPMRGSIEQAVVRRRQTITGGNADGMVHTAIDGSQPERRTSSTLEVDYEYGRRVEEVIAAPGAVRRLTIGIIVPPRISEEQQRRIANIVQVAAGIDESRGDIVSVQPLGQATNETVASELSETRPDVMDSESTTTTGSNERVSAGSLWNRVVETPWMLIALAVLAAFAVLAIAGALMRGRQPRTLNSMEREQLLQEIRRTLGDDQRVVNIPAKQ